MATVDWQSILGGAPQITPAQRAAAQPQANNDANQLALMQAQAQQMQQAAPQPAINSPANPLWQMDSGPNSPSSQNPAQPLGDSGPQVNGPAKAGVIKGLLTNFFHGAGQGMLHEAGLPTDFDRQQVNQNMALKQAQLSALQDFHNQSLALGQDKLDTANTPVPFGTPDIRATMGLPDDYKATPQTANALMTLYGKLPGQQLKNDGAQGVAQTKADASTENSTYATNAKTDIAKGNLGLGYARLSVMKQIQAMKASGAAANSPTSMRLNKADLANNAQGNINEMSDLISKNPGLFGKIAGRFTETKSMIGSDDPAIRQLGNLIHNTAIATNGIHGLRSAEAIPGTEATMLNRFRDGPEATQAGLQETSRSLNDFITDAAMGKGVPASRFGGAAAQQQAPAMKTLTDNGTPYNIPAAMIPAFLKEHPNAR